MRKHINVGGEVLREGKLFVEFQKKWEKRHVSLNMQRLQIYHGQSGRFISSFELDPPISFQDDKKSLTFKINSKTSSIKCMTSSAAELETWRNSIIEVIAIIDRRERIGGGEEMVDVLSAITLDGHVFHLDKKRYRLTHTLGKGSYGVVAGGKDKVTNRAVAIKQISNLYERPDKILNVLREVRILHVMHHENIIELLNIDIYNDILYVITEQCSYSLHQYLRTDSGFENAPVESILGVIKQLIDVLCYLHSLDIIHRDIKPANILLNKPKRKGEDSIQVKLCDFGMAVTHASTKDPNDSLCECVGSLWYCAPEILLRSGLYDTAQDVWSLGCTFAEMFLRKPLITGTSEIDQLKRIIALLVGKLSSLDIDFPLAQRSHDVLVGIPSQQVPIEQQLPSILASSTTKYHGKLQGLLQCMLFFNPTHRITCAAACCHSLFFNYSRSLTSTPSLSRGVRRPMPSGQCHEDNSPSTFNISDHESITDSGKILAVNEREGESEDSNAEEIDGSADSSNMEIQSSWNRPHVRKLSDTSLLQLCHLEGLPANIGRDALRELIQNEVTAIQKNLCILQPPVISTVPSNSSTLLVSGDNSPDGGGEDVITAALSSLSTSLSTSLSSSRTRRPGGATGGGPGVFGLLAPGGGGNGGNTPGTVDLPPRETMSYDQADQRTRVSDLAVDIRRQLSVETLTSTRTDRTPTSTSTTTSFISEHSPLHAEQLSPQAWRSSIPSSNPSTSLGPEKKISIFPSASVAPISNNNHATATLSHAVRHNQLSYRSRSNTNLTPIADENMDGHFNWKTSEPHGHGHSGTSSLSMMSSDASSDTIISKSRSVASYCSDNDDFLPSPRKGSNSSIFGAHVRKASGVAILPAIGSAGNPPCATIGPLDVQDGVAIAIGTMGRGNDPKGSGSSSGVVELTLKSRLSSAPLKRRERSSTNSFGVLGNSAAIQALGLEESSTSCTVAGDVTPGDEVSVGGSEVSRGKEVMLLSPLVRDSSLRHVRSESEGHSDGTDFREAIRQLPRQFQSHTSHLPAQRHHVVHTLSLGESFLISETESDDSDTPIVHRKTGVPDAMTEYCTTDAGCQAAGEGGGNRIQSVSPHSTRRFNRLEPIYPMISTSTSQSPLLNFSVAPSPSRNGENPPLPSASGNVLLAAGQSGNSNSPHRSLTRSNSSVSVTRQRTSLRREILSKPRPGGGAGGKAT